MLALRAAIRRATLTIKTGRPARLGLLTSLAFQRFVRLYRKFDPDQPRDERGRWTETGAGPREDYASLRDDEDAPIGAPVTVRKDRVGDPLIDGATDVLEEKMKKAMEIAGQGSGMAYGRRVHEEFAEAVRNAGLPGVTVEQSWLGGGLSEGALSKAFEPMSCSETKPERFWQCGT